MKFVKQCKTYCVYTYTFLKNVVYQLSTKTTKNIAVSTRELVRVRANSRQDGEADA